MHESLTSSSTINLSRSNSDDLQTPISRVPHFHSTDNLGWSQSNNKSAEYSTDELLASHHSFTSHLTTGRRANQAGPQKVTYTANMLPHSETNASERAQVVGQRWHINANGQLVDSDSANWDLADEIVRLKIDEVPGDGDDVHPQLRTPAKCKFMPVTVAHINEASPLETSSSASIGSSPHASENEISVSHSRGSSTDTTVSSSRESVGAVPTKGLLSKPPLKVNTGNDIKERPHSFSGGLSTADLRRLQQAGEASELIERQHHRIQDHYPDHVANSTELATYPSILNSTIHRPQPHLHPQLFDYRNGSSQLNQAADQEELQRADQPVHQYNLNSLSQGHALGDSAISRGRSNDMPHPSVFRQSSRKYQQQNVVTPSMMPFAPSSHLSLGSSQQQYNTLQTGSHHDHPAVARVQQQHNVFRPSHHHSASDPSMSVRDTAAMALFGINITPGVFSYPNQFYGAEQFPIADPAVVASRSQVPYANQYPLSLPLMNSDPVANMAANNGSGPSANNRKLGLYKTELCRSWEEKGTCRYGTKCQFAHGEDEIRRVARHPKYKTEICRTFWVSGTCPYGKRCCFIHTELPAAGGSVPAPGGSGTPGTENTAQSSHGRARSLSTNSDPNEANVSMLSRLKRNQDPISSATPTDGSGNSFQFTRPPTGSLRVDTSALDTSVKQNKSAYPTFTSNGILLPAPERSSQKVPGPVTAGPDLGRHNNARREIVGYNQRTHKANASSTSSLRDLDNFDGSPSYMVASGDGSIRSGHSRTGSAGNWAHTPRNTHSIYAGTSSAGEIIGSSPWPVEFGINSSRMNEKVWA